MRSLTKNLLVFAAACVIFGGALEVASRVVYRIYHGESLSREDLRRRLHADRVERGGDSPAPKEVGVPDQPVILHPYFGFVINPNKPGVNELGFFRRSPLTVRSPDKVVVMLMGGSVADQVFYLGGESLVDELAASPAYAGKEIELISTAVGGYKQPQQMVVLSVLLALGAEYDVVVNLDGFNEIDTAHDNVVEGVSPYFPHNWKLQAKQGFDATTALQMGRIELVRQQRRRLHTIFATPILDRSAFFLSLWDFLDRGREANLRRQMAELEGELSTGDLPPQISGPPSDYADMDAFFSDMANLWARSSLQMARLCEESGARYLHFLQPNQYFPGSKELTEEERDVAYDPTFAGKDRVPQAYPKLIEKGRELRDSGVAFSDLTMLYADQEGTIYNDFCCHVNRLGAQIMARAIARAIAGDR